MQRFPSIAFALVLPGLALAQAQERAAPPPPPADVLRGGWNNRLANSNARQWEQANALRPGNADYQLNWLRSEYNARMGNNNGRLSPADKAELDTIAQAIRTGAPASFEAHLAQYLVEFPAADAFAQLDAAHRLAPDRPELAAPMLNKALRDGDAAALRQWSAALLRRNAVAKPLLQAAGDVLRSIPENAVLFTNGDMDGQPVLVEQWQHGRNPGVLVVDRRLLADAGYRAQVWRAAGATGAVPGDGPPFAEGLLASGARPVYFALSLDPAWLAAFRGRLHAVGAAFRVGAPDPADAALLARHWAELEKPLDAGPLSRNYLLPGAVLLARYRAQGNGRAADALEAELRKIAAAAGGLRELQQAGVLNP